MKNLASLVTFVDTGCYALPPEVATLEFVDRLRRLMNGKMSYVIRQEARVCILCVRTSLEEFRELVGRAGID